MPPGTVPVAYTLQVSLIRYSLVCVFLAGAALAQESSLSGIVTDSTGAPVEGAAAAVRNLETGLRRTAATDLQGRYVFVPLPVGVYELRVSKRDFETAVRAGIRLATGEHAQVGVTLKLGTMNESVTVPEDAPAVDTPPGLVGAQAVKNLPLNGRSYDQLLTLNPGVTNYTSQKLGGIGISNSTVANQFSVDGRRPQENLFLLDGVEYTGAAEINLTPGGTSGQLLGVDAVREFNVESGAYGAQYGKRAGAQVQITTSSGTNEMHGSVYEFVRNSAFDARNFFDRQSVPGFGRNQFGGSLGGAIRKNRTFFFTNYEGFRQHLGLSNVTFVPDNNVRNGYLPGPGGTLTHLGLAPGVARLLDYWPVANGPDLGAGIAEAFNSPVQGIQEDFGVARLDQILSAADSLSAVYTVDDSRDNTPTQNPLSLDVESLREQVASLHETHEFSPAAVNSAVVGFSRGAFLYTGEPTVNGPGFVSGRPMSALVVGGSATPNAPSQITLAGSNFGSNLFINRNLYTAADTVTVVKGIHQLSAGAWVERIQANDREALGQYGQATFSSLAALMQGVVTVFSAVPQPTPLSWRSLEGAFFLQDEMRLSDRFTLTLGLRAESTNGWNEAFGRASTFVPGPGGALLTTPHVGSSALTVNRAVLLPEPRAGFAWNPFASGRTVIRAGAGIYHSLQDGLSFRMDQNAPFNTSITLKNQPVATLNVIPGAPAPAGSLVSPAGVQPDLYTPTVISYNFTVEQQLSANTVLNVSYQGSHGYHEIISIDPNEAYSVTCPAAPCPATLAAGTIYYPPNAPLANPQLGGGWSWYSEGVSIYNALQIDLRRRLAAGLELRGVYTWSKSLDDGSTLNASASANAPGLAEDARNLRLDWGPSTFDARQAAAISGSYDLPVGQGRRFAASAHGVSGFLVSGWSLDAIETLRSGFPFTPELSFNPSNNGDPTNPVRPSLNPAFAGPVILGSPNRWFNPNAFAVPPNGTYGTLGRNVLYGPALAELDAALVKDSHLGETFDVQFRAEAFNIANQPSFNTPNLIVFTSPTAAPSPTAGVITSTATTSRQLQFALKLLW